MFFKIEYEELQFCDVSFGFRIIDFNYFYQFRFYFLGNKK